MKANRQAMALLGVLLAACSTASPARGADAEMEAAAAKLLKRAGVPAGLAVHLGCGDGRLTAALGAASPSLLVQGLSRDAAGVERAREAVRRQGLYGRVSIDLLGPSQKRLPYVDNLANLIIVQEPSGIAEQELLRVLRPGGVLLKARRDGEWLKTVKPRPDTIDDWTHYLHDGTNNAVAHDQQVGPPRRLQWVGGPRYTRHHDRMSSVSAVVSAGGRVFYIFDEGSRASVLTPPKWRLIARDAFNGVVLWKRPIERWHTHLWPLKSGPAQLPRRLVAQADVVYATLSLDGPVTALDAATGGVLRVYEQTAAAEEILCSNGVLFVLAKRDGSVADGTDRFRNGYRASWWDGQPRTIVAVDAASGETLWERTDTVLPVTLAVDGRRVVFHDGERIVCLSRETGRELWRSEPVARAEEIRAFYAPALVLHQDVVLFSGGETAGLQTGSWYTSGNDTMTALSAETGKTLWTAYHPPSGYRSPEDLLVVNGLVWTGETTSGRAVGLFTGRDLHSGEVKVEFTPDLDIYWFHHRCYRGKATDNFLLMSRAGIELIDINKKHWDVNHWIRGACLYGIMPANGLIYAPQHPCACYMEAKLDGFNAVAPGDGPRIPRSAAKPERLQRGPAYGAACPGRAAADEWPTYRHDAARSGRASSDPPGKLDIAWTADLGGKLSSPVVADGNVFLALIDRHAVAAVDAASGEVRWRRTVGGRVDSPPTYWKGRLLFGCADGYVYCLRAADGQLAWRFLAAPMDQRLTAFGQIESVWPLHGSVLVLNDVLYCVAGRSMFLDDGLRLWRLDPATGRPLSQTILNDVDPQAKKHLQDYVSWLNMPPALPDVLSSDGRYVYMRSQPFQLDGRRLPLKPIPRGPDADQGAPLPLQDPQFAHLFCPTGFLDDEYFHRSYWLYGSTYVSGWSGYYLAGKAAPAGRILVEGEDAIYGFGRKPQYYRWTVPIEHELFAAEKRFPSAEELKNPQGRAPRFAVQRRWSRSIPLYARALAMAGGVLLVAGPPDLVDEDAALKRVLDPAVQQQLAEQDAALEGRRGGLLLAAAASDGGTIGLLQLPAPPVFDGLAVAGGRAYLAATDGRLLCVGPPAPQDP